MSDAAEAALAEALAEVETLRSENARLRDLLGLNTREADGHRQAWAPTLFTQTAASESLESSSPLAAKLALLRSLFGARADVIPTSWLDRRRRGEVTGQSVLIVRNVNARPDPRQDR